MTLRKLALALTLSAAAALPLFAQAIPRNADGSNPNQSQIIAHHIYRALLGRDADPAGLADTAADVQRGRTRERVDAIVGGTEFRGRVMGWTPERILEQVYQGLLGRSPDSSSSGWLTAVKQGRYADLITGIIGSAEFQNRLAAELAAPAGTAPTATTGSSAVACQQRVVERIRNELTGFVFIQFDKASLDGNTVSGAATDVSDGGRRLTYRCAGGGRPTYTYDDGRRARSAPAEGTFANDVVRACHTAIRDRVLQNRQVTDVVFESAGLMAAGADTQAVRGLGFEKLSGGKNGGNFDYSCDMRGTSVSAADVRRR